MIQLLPHKDLYAIKFPLDTTGFDIRKDYYATSIAYISDNPHYFCFGKFIPKGDWKILGEVTKDSISFDSDDIVNKKMEEGSMRYENYDDKYANDFLLPDDSFMSLLKLHGVYFFNPKGATPPKFAMLSLEKKYIEDCDKITKEWQQYEDNLVEKVLIIQKL